MSDDARGRLIGRQLEDIDALLERSSSLLETPVDSEPSFERLAALTTVLDSFYNSLERIFGDIVKEYDPTQPEGGRWHTELLNQVAGQTETRPALISEESRQRLRDYLAFRHRSRHSSANYLAWDPMAQLVADVPLTWNAVRAEILRFLQEQASSADPE